MMSWIMLLLVLDTIIQYKLTYAAGDFRSESAHVLLFVDNRPENRTLACCVVVP